MNEVEQSNWVVGQDKGSGAGWSTEPEYATVSYDFLGDHGDPPEHTVDRPEWTTVTRALRGLSVPVFFLAGIILLTAIGKVFQLRIMLTDSSAATGIYRQVSIPAGRAALVAACLPAVIARQGVARGYLRHGDCPAGAEPVAKVIGALSGDVIDLEPDRVSVNGVPFPNSRTATRDSRGRLLPHMRWGVRRVSAGEVWLLGFNDVRSWDARYFGAVPSSVIRGVLKPVITW